jgi:dTDP-4-amino-4,6-dideoxygalactose transaminase
MNNIRLMKPYIAYDEVEAEFKAVFESGIFTRGHNVENLRNELAEYTGAKHAFLMTSATTALWMCLKLLNIGAGDEVIVSDFSFPATANAVEDLGATPVFADVSVDTFNMLPDELEKKISARTKAVIFVDALGNPSGLIKIKEICDKHGLPLIEDAACGIGSSENNLRCGSIADLTCFSFHPRKLISSGEGGAITTNRDDWADWLEMKLMHGSKGMKGIAMDFVDYGYNFRLPELQAIMVIKQLAKIEKIVDDRNDIRNAYISKLEPLGFIAQKITEAARSNIQSLVFKVPENCDRDALVLALRRGGIETTIGTYAMSNGKYFIEKYSDPQINAAQLERTTITLPCFDGLDVNVVTSPIQGALGE